ncbi:hypothetical protein U1Q18_025275 [Sarracenia purpurea var. burkii]
MFLVSPFFCLPPCCRSFDLIALGASRLNCWPCWQCYWLLFFLLSLGMLSYDVPPLLHCFLLPGSIINWFAYGQCVYYVFWFWVYFSALGFPLVIVKCNGALFQLWSL